MNISVIGRHLNVREDTKALIEKKLAKFDKFFPSGADASVTCKSEGDEKRMEITISVGGTLFRAEESSSSFQNALDGCMSSIERQIRKNKTRLEKKMRSSISVPVADAADVPAEEELLFDVRTKTFPLKPMTTDEAILQMNLLGHSFYLFCDSQTEETCAVYKRRDGAYGLIVPQK
ncbi:MAG: ribosome-associated translation inhibitor RaiA [Clostridia bacterium]|nr:ribosome-associated translation inhibitor RaiA [Clostridia bacterium]